MIPIVLASASPRRRQLMHHLRVPFLVDPSGVDEPSLSAPHPADLALALARAKALDVSTRHPDAAVIGADTLVDLDGRVLNKPSDAADAVRMLTLLSGHTHQVHTGLAVWRSGSLQVAVVTAAVRMRAIDRATVEAYVATGEPLDKAGAYAAQGLGAALVDRIEGSYLAVVGLPLLALRDLLLAHGVAVPAAIAELEPLERGASPAG